MLTRNADLYKHILGIDIDPNTLSIADKINVTWLIEKKMRNIIADANTCNLQGPEVVINCSADQMDKLDWFDNIVPGTLTCIQSTSVTDTNEPWLIKQPTPTFDDFQKKYVLSTTMYCDILPIDYGNWGYDRYMIIGIK